MNDIKRRRLFIRNTESGDPATYCGDLDDPDDVRKSVKYVVDAELDEIIGGFSDAETLHLEVWELTDQEIEELAEY